MLEKRLEDLTRLDLLDLHARQVTERRTLDYKRDLKFANREDNKEFVADVLSFANASGGDIVFGMDEARDPITGGKLGYPEAPIGTALWAADDEVKRAMEQCVRDSTDPKLPSIGVEVIDGGFLAGKVVVVRVPKSPAGPHVSLLDRGFYSRATTGKYLLDVRQLRSAFVDAAELDRSARALRTERVALIDSRRRVQKDDASAGNEELPLRLIVKPQEAVLVVHVVASSFLDRTRRLDVARLDWKKVIPQPGNDFRLDARYNLDGLVIWPALTFGSGNAPETTAYWQVFRSGAVEYVGTYHPNRGADTGLLVGGAVEKEVLGAVEASVGLLASASADYPMFVFVTVLSVRGRKMVNGKPEPTTFLPAIERDALVLPDAAIETSTTDAASALRQVFDAFWQAGGAPRSPSYAVDGTRIP
jgi:hypothetical protein